METSKRSCVYVVTGGKGSTQSVYGYLHSTQQETIAYLKTKCQSLSAFNDDRFSFTIDGVEIDDEPGLWRDVTDDLPLKPKPIIHLRITDRLMEVKMDEDARHPVPEQTSRDPVPILAHVLYSSTPPTAETVQDQIMISPRKPLQKLFDHFATHKLGRHAASLVFSAIGHALDGKQTCAEAGVVAGTRIVVTDRAMYHGGGAVAGPSTGLGPRSDQRAPVEEGVEGVVVVNEARHFARNLAPPAANKSSSFGSSAAVYRSPGLPQAHDTSGTTSSSLALARYFAGLGSVDRPTVDTAASARHAESSAAADGERAAFARRDGLFSRVAGEGSTHAVGSVVGAAGEAARRTAKNTLPSPPPSVVDDRLSSTQPEPVEREESPDPLGVWEDVEPSGHAQIRKRASGGVCTFDGVVRWNPSGAGRESIAKKVKIE